MKFKSILGAAVCAIVLACSTSSVFASGESFKIGTPIDLDSGNEVTALEAGQVVAFPVDMLTDKTFVSMGFDSVCNSEYLVAGANLTKQQYDVADTLGETIDDEAKIAGQMLIFSVGEMGRRGFEAYGEPGVTTGMANWSDAYARTVNADSPEFYLIYQVKKSVSVDDLNVELITPNGENKCVIGIYQVGSTLEIQPEAAKANKCFGAFKINIDSSNLDKWIQALSVKINGGSAIAVTEYVTTDDVNFSFPVRITADKGLDSVSVEVFADVTADEAGNGESETVSLGSFDVALNSPSSYAENKVN